MALKATIYKADIELADLDRQHYDQLQLTIACHPSETLERMAARMLAYCLNAEASLSFTKGLSTDDEPDIWSHHDHGDVKLWVEIGQPEPPRIKSALPHCDELKIYSFGKSSETWWKLHGNALSALNPAGIYRLAWEDISDLASLLSRNNSASITITEGQLYINLNGEDRQLALQTLFEP